MTYLINDELENIINEKPRIRKEKIKEAAGGIDRGRT